MEFADGFDHLTVQAESLVGRSNSDGRTVKLYLTSLPLVLVPVLLLSGCGRGEEQASAVDANVTQDKAIIPAAIDTDVLAETVSTEKVLKLRMGMTLTEVKEIFGFPDKDVVNRGAYPPLANQSMELLVERQLLLMTEEKLRCHYPSLGLWLCFNFHGNLCKAYIDREGK